MRMDDQRESSNIEDRRGMKGPVAAGGGFLALIVVLVCMYFGVDPRPFVSQLGQTQGGAQQQSGPVELTAEEQAQSKFVSQVLASTEDVWTKVFQSAGEQYEKPTLVFFRGQVSTNGCGGATSAAGPFYCPADKKVYIDLSFYDVLKKQLNSPGDFAQAYVIAHEVGHHVQNLLGYSAEVEKIRRSGADQAEQNRWSVRLELQADYLAGVWAHHANSKLAIDGSDLKEALNAAHNIGDDTLQGHRADPDSFTHGTSEQRMRWFKAGFESGDISKMKVLFDIEFERL
jgi:uncharacterized protein